MFSSILSQNYVILMVSYLLSAVLIDNIDNRLVISTMLFSFWYAMLIDMLSAMAKTLNTDSSIAPVVTRGQTLFSSKWRIEKDIKTGIKVYFLTFN